MKAPKSPAHTARSRESSVRRTLTVLVIPALAACGGETVSEAPRADAPPAGESTLSSRQEPALGLEALPGRAATPGAVVGTSPGWQTTVQRRISDSEYAIHAQDQGFRASSRSQSFLASFDARGAAIQPRDGQAEMVRVGGVAVTRDDRRTALPGAELALGACRTDGALDVDSNCLKRLEGTRGAVTELWENRPDGLEHSFIVKEAEPGTGELSVLVAIEGADVEIDDGGQAAQIRQRGGALSLRYSGLKAWDATGRELLAHMQARPEGLALVVDDVGAQYPLTIDPLLTNVDWTAEGNQVQASFGSSVASAGDVNADGFDDVIVGAHFYDNGQLNEGRAFLYLGSAAGVSATAAWTAEGNQANAELGTSVASAGDVNGDGFSDVIVGAPLYGVAEHQGRAFVYLGGAAGLAATAAWTGESNGSDGYFGMSVAGAGDVNGDGFDDVVVGAPYDDTFGRAIVYHGSAGGLATSPAWTATGLEAGVDDLVFGASVASAGDVNADGFDDVIIGASDEFLSSAGGAVVYHGSASGLGTAAAWMVEGDDEDKLGLSVAGAGDVNGDGFDDVIVGSPEYEPEDAAYLGRAQVYHGSATGLGTSAAWSVSNVAEWFGYSVSSAGDVNNDGFDDIVVGAPLHGNGQFGEGVALVYVGGATGLATVAAWTVEGDSGNAGLGESVSGAGDINGDGLDDVIAGGPGYSNGQSSEGRAYLFLSTPDRTVESNQQGASLGVSVAGAGDVNGDGFDDVIVGAPYFDNGQTDEGRAFVYLGGLGGPATTAAWTAESNQANSRFAFSVAGAGDINRDGFDDVIVGAFLFDNGQTNEGRAYVYRGSSAGLTTAAVWTAESNQFEAYYGISVASAGDVNGDGFGDVIVGARQYNNGHGNEGGAFVYLGSTAGLATSAVWTAEGNSFSAFFGTSVAGAGDVNGDGFDDVVVGAEGHDNGQTDEGRAYVYLGSAAGPSLFAPWTREINQAGADFGHSVAGAGDVNGDGFDDVIVGAQRYDNGQTDEGRVFGYLGSSVGLSTNASWTTESNQAGARFGVSVASAGDVDGDGWDDVIVGAELLEVSLTDEGAAYIYRGSQGGLSTGAAWAGRGNQANARLGGSVASAGDVNGDGFDDIILGAPLYDNGQTNEGRAYVLW